jgi:hypothetical protein
MWGVLGLVFFVFLVTVAVRLMSQRDTVKRTPTMIDGQPALQVKMTLYLTQEQSDALDRFINTRLRYITRADQD